MAKKQKAAPQTPRSRLIECGKEWRERVRADLRCSVRYDVTDVVVHAEMARRMGQYMPGGGKSSPSVAAQCCGAKAFPDSQELPRGAALAAFCAAADVSADWILTGQGTMRRLAHAAQDADWAAAATAWLQYELQSNPPGPADGGMRPERWNLSPEWVRRFLLAAVRASIESDRVVLAEAFGADPSLPMAAYALAVVADESGNSKLRPLTRLVRDSVQRSVDGAPAVTSGRMFRVGVEGGQLSVPDFSIAVRAPENAPAPSPAASPARKQKKPKK